MLAMLLWYCLSYVHNADSTCLSSVDAKSEKCESKGIENSSAGWPHPEVGTKIRSHGSSDMKLSFGALKE